MSSKAQSIVGDRARLFWGGCVAIALGVLLHLPMRAMAHRMGNHLSGMPMDASMWFGMAAILVRIRPLAPGAVIPGPTCNLGHWVPYRAR